MTDSPVQPQTQTFYVDSDYADFEPAKTQLKFRSLYDQPHPITLLIYVAISLPFLLMSPFIIAVPFYEWSVSQHPEVEAAIIACERESSARSPTLRLTYTFPLLSERGERRVITSSDIVSSMGFGCDDLPLGAVITVKYNPDDPEDSLISDERLLPSPILTYGMYGCTTIGGTLFLIMGLLLITSTPLAFIEYIRAKRKYPRLLRKGVAVDGVIEAIKSRKPIIILGKSDRNPKFRVRVSYRFTAPDGSSHTGVQRFYCPEKRLPALPKVGTPVKILYAADNCHVML